MKPFIEVRILVEYLDNFHAVDVLDEGVVHLLADHIIGTNFILMHTEYMVIMAIRLMRMEAKHSSANFQSTKNIAT